MAVTIDYVTHSIRVKETGAGPVKEAVVTIPVGDIDTDVTIVTPASGNSIFIVGLIVSESNPSNLKIKFSDDGGGKYKTIELGANQGIWSPVGMGILPIPQDYPLVIQSSADLNSLSILYVEAKKYFI